MDNCFKSSRYINQGGWDIFMLFTSMHVCVCVYIYIYIYIYIYNFFSDILIKLLNIEKIGFEINLPCVENTHRDCIYNKENMD